jgi:hypothetical protein
MVKKHYFAIFNSLDFILASRRIRKLKDDAGRKNGNFDPVPTSKEKNGVKLHLETFLFVNFTSAS